MRSTSRHSADSKPTEGADDEDDFIVRLISSPVRSSESVADVVGDSMHDAKNRGGDGHTLSYESGAKVLCILAAKAERYVPCC